MSKLSNETSDREMGLRLTAIRDRSGLTQFEFAERLGLSPRAYGNYERGEREVPVALFKMLFDQFRIDPTWLLSGPDLEPMYTGMRRLDVELLQSVIQLVDGWLTKHKRTMKPEKKARVISLAYEHCVEEGKVDSAHLVEMLSLAA